MADLATIRTALATRITAGTGLRTLAEARDQISPPVGVILPGQPYIIFGATMDGAVTVNLRVLLAISDAAPTDKVQRAIDAYLGIGGGTTAASIPGAIAADPTLGGAVHFAEAISVGNYGRVQYAGEVYFGGRLDVQIGSV
jgi:hypothetical protein